MKIVAKIFAAPVVLLLTLIVPFFTFLLTMTGVVFWIASVLVFIVGAVLLFTGQALGGIAFLGIAFIVSPCGLPSLIASLIGRMEAVRLSLKAFVLY